MKLFGIFTLAQLTAGSSVSHRQRRRDVAELIEDSPLNQCTRFITANTFNNKVESFQPFATSNLYFSLSSTSE